MKKGEEITHNGWTGKEQAIQEDFIWGVGPGSPLPNNAEYKTEPDTIKIKIKDLIRLFVEYYMPKRNTYHDRGDFFWAKQTEEKTQKEFWRRIIEKYVTSTHSRQELLRSKYMTGITDKKLRDRIMKEESLELKKIIELIEQNTYKKNKQSTTPRALMSSKTKTSF